MKRSATFTIIATALTTLFIVGCDTAGAVFDTINLAFRIVDVWT
jgi:hypothetical protein